MNQTDYNEDIWVTQTVIWTLYLVFFTQYGILMYNVYSTLPNETNDDEEEDEEDDEEEEEEVKEVKKPVVYEEKYIDQWKLQSNSEKTEDQLKQLRNSIVMEKTPLGNVIMFWNHDRGSFTFHADSTIPYRYLEVVARKYVIQNQCKQLYIMNDVETVKELEKMKEDEEKKEIEEKKNVEEKKEVKEVSNVFAKLKTYNQGSIQSVKTIQRGGNVQKSGNMRQSGIRKKEQTTPVQENANRYTYEGKIVNFSFLKKEARSGKKVISFAEYKKMIEKI